MDFCRNVSVSGGLPSEYPPEQVLSPPCSKLGGITGSLDDLFSGQNTEVDVSLEWLSIFVEDCFSSTGQCLPAVASAAAAAAAPKTTTTTTTTTTSVEVNTISSSANTKPSRRLQKPSRQNPEVSLQKFVFPSKARSKRKRATSRTTVKGHNGQMTNWVHHLKLNPESNLHQITSSDPPLLQQAYWLADSELILPQKIKEESNCINPVKNEEEEEEEEEERKDGVEEEEEEEEKGMVMMGTNTSSSLDGSSSSNGGVVGQARRCSHCLSQRTPQWRAGPLGPKTLCNACGVRYKSGRLLPEYRPAKSPTFVSYLHSNSHKKVLEMRSSSPPSSSSH